MITVSAIVGALIGLALTAAGDALHPYAVVIACAALGAVAAFVVLNARAVPWAASVGLLAGDAWFVVHAVRTHRATTA